MNISNNLPEYGVDEDHEDKVVDYAEPGCFSWRNGKSVNKARIIYTQDAPIHSRRMIPIPTQSGTVRRVPLIIRRAPSSFQTSASTSSTPVLISSPHSSAFNKNGLLDDRSSRVFSSTSISGQPPYLVPYSNEETVQTSDSQDNLNHLVMEDEVELHQEMSNLKAKIELLNDSNIRLRGELVSTRDDKRELQMQLRRAEKLLERQAVELAEYESAAQEVKKRERELEKRIAREAALKERKRKTLMVLPCLPNRKVAFSKATKQAQALRLRILNQYLTELVGPVAAENRLEEKNLVVLRWRKAHVPRPSLEIGRQLFPHEEQEFCTLFGIDDRKKKEMKRYLGNKGIDLFGPSERALKVRRWRMLQREKKRKGERMEEDVPDGCRMEDEEEAGNDEDDDSLLEDIEGVMDEEEFESQMDDGQSQCKQICPDAYDDDTI